MQFQLSLDIPKLPKPIKYQDKILLIGSCFTEHISDRLAANKFMTCSNPHGILFNPISVAKSLNSYSEGKVYAEEELFYLNELWNSWDHHTRFSDVDKERALQKINDSQKEASAFLKETDWVMITLGSAFQYYLKEKNLAVANNHRAPAQWFEKRLLSIKEITEELSQAIHKIQSINPKAQILFTISPVRHIRDGVVDNNRSKARLIEAVYALCNSFENAHYFPAYELVIDILRDYRFYDVDMVHPNYPATQFVWERFVASCVEEKSQEIMEQVQDVMTAKNHRTRFPNTDAHRNFLASYKTKTETLMTMFPFLKLDEELNYFSL